MSYPPPQPDDEPQLPSEHPGAKSALILGIVALAGGFLCVLPLVVGPFAITKGRRVLSEIDASDGRLGGRGSAQTGLTLGLVSTIVLALWILLLLFLFPGGGYERLIEEIGQDS